MSWEPRGFKSSDRLTADTAVKAAAGTLGGVILLGDGTNAATVRIYDNASAASGTSLAELVVAASTTNRTETWMAPGGGVPASAGIYADLTGTGAVVYVYYR